jgi:hypothetical protein
VKTAQGSAMPRRAWLPRGISAVTHSGLADAEVCASHDQGWAHYLDRLAVAASGGDPGPDIPRKK